MALLFAANLSSRLSRYTSTASGSAVCRSVSPAWPFWPPGFLSDFSRKLRTREGFFSPSLDGGLPLFELFKPSRRSSSAIRAFRDAISLACALTSAISSSREGSFPDSRLI